MYIRCTYFEATTTDKEYNQVKLDFGDLKEHTYYIQNIEWVES